MITNKKIDFLTIVSIIIATFFALFVYCQVKNNQTSAIVEYESKVFAKNYVHHIDITMSSTDLNDLLTNALEEKYYQADITIDDEKFTNVGLRTKGNSSLRDVYERTDTNKYSLKIEFDHYNASQLYYGLDKLCLNNIVDDPTFMKDYLVYDMMEYIGVASPLVSYTNVTINGEDCGLYMAVETVEDSFKLRNYNTSSGIIYKPDMDSLENNDDRQPEKTKKEQEKESNGTMLGADLLYTDNNLNNYLAIFTTAKSAITTSDKKRMVEILYALKNNENISNYIDIENVIKYFVVHNFVVNFDSYTSTTSHNYYLYEKDGQLKIIPWDYNLAFGGLSVSDESGIDYSNATNLINMPIDSPLVGVASEERPLWNFIMLNDEYRKLYHEYFNNFLQSYFTSNYYKNLINNVYAMIKPYISNNIKKSFYNQIEAEAAVETLKQFCLLRSLSINYQLNGYISINDKKDITNYVDATSIDLTKLGYKRNIS